MPFPRLGMVLPVTAVVLSNDAPSLVKAAARIAKILFGDRIQICDGIDDNVEIQAAVDALSEGGELKLLEGTFSISNTNNIHSKPIVLSGSGIRYSTGGGTRLELADGADCPIFSIGFDTFGGSHGFLMRDMYLYGRGQQGTNPLIKFIDNLHDSLFDNLLIINGGNTGQCIEAYADLVDGHNITFFNCWFEAADKGVDIGGNSHSFDACHFAVNNYGIFNRSPRTSFTNCHFGPNEDSGYYGVYTGQVTITGSVFNANNNSASATHCDIELDHSGKHTITGNVFVHDKQPYAVKEVGGGGSLIASNIFDGYPTLFNVETARYSNQYSDLFMNCILASVTHVRAAMTPDGSTGNVGTAPAENGRGLMIRINNTDGVNPQSPSGGDIIVHGIDAKGNTISETFTVPTDVIAAGGNTDIIGDNAFTSGISVDYYTETNANITVSVGTSDKLGLKNIFYEDADVYKLTLNAADKSAYLTAAKVDSDYETVNCDEVNGVGAGIAGGDNIEFCYRSNLNIAV